MYGFMKGIRLFGFILAGLAVMILCGSVYFHDAYASEPADKPSPVVKYTLADWKKAELNDGVLHLDVSEYKLDFNHPLP